MAIETILRFEKSGVKLWLDGDKLKYRSASGALSEQELAELKAQKAELVDFLSTGKRVSGMSANQLGYWADFKLHPHSSAYNLITAYKLSHSTCHTKLQHAFNAVLKHQDVMSSTFHECEEGFYQLRNPNEDYEIEHIQLQGGSDELNHKLEWIADQPFNLSLERPFRAYIVSLNDGQSQQSWFVLLTHHIVTEIYSIAILMEQLEALYLNAAEGRELTLAKPYDIADYVLNEKAYLASPQAEKDKQYWQTLVTDSLPVLELTPNKVRPAVKQYKGGRVNVALPAGLSSRIDEFSKRKGITSFVFFQSVYFALLNRYTGQDDIVIGISNAGRELVDNDFAVGNFVNPLATRVQASDEISFDELAEICKHALINAFEHKTFPFTQIVNELYKSREVSRSPVFQTSMTLTKVGELMRKNGTGIFEEIHPLSGQRGSFDDLGLAVFGTNEQYKLSMHFDTALFEQATIEYMLSHLQNMIESVLSNSTTQISKLNMLDDAERAKIVAWGQSPDPVSLPHEMSNLALLFEAQAAKTPQSAALIAQDESLSFAELNESANQIAHYLKSQGVAPGVRVGFYAPSSVQVITVILAIAKCSGVYVPISAEDAIERVKTIVEGAQLSLLVAADTLAEQLDVEAKVIALSHLAEVTKDYSKSNMPIHTFAADTACIFYTSGSTGNPKGVPVSHQAIISRVVDANYIDIKPKDRVAHVSSLSFDPSSFELWGGLLNGAAVVCISKNVLLNPELLASTIDYHEVTIILVTTALLNRLADTQHFPLASVKQIIFGGEKVNMAAVARALESRFSGKLIHGYGPTECTTVATYHIVSEKDLSATTIPIGKAVSGTQMYVVDKHGEMSGIGVGGELFLGGVGLSQGYINNKALSEAKFRVLPHLADGQTLYATGDFVRYNNVGEIEFIGRRDDMVKINGFTIELGEVTAAIHQCPGVREVFVHVHTTDNGDKRLVAYCTSDNALTTDYQLRQDIAVLLKSRLSPAMLPKQVIQLPEMPLNKNGKIDTKRLPVVSMEAEEARQNRALNTLEQSIFDIWTTVLGQVQLSAAESLWNQGANSLNAVKAANMISALVNKPINVVDLLRYDTIIDIAEFIQSNEENGAESPLVCLNKHASDLPPVVLIHPVGGSILSYVPLAQLLSSDRAIYAIASDLKHYEKNPTDSLSDLARSYLALLTQHIGAHQYVVAGWSLGGTVAVEMAALGDEFDVKIDKTILIDSRNPVFEQHNIEIYRDPEWLLYFFARELDIAIEQHEVTQYISGAKFEDLPSSLLQLAKDKGHMFQHIPESIVQERFDIFAKNLQLFATHKPSRYHGNVDLLMAEEGSVLSLTVPLEAHWKECVSKVQCAHIPGNHFSLIQPPNIVVLVKKLKELLSHGS
ncbi:amino acid adenylation domain-containing protein [Pseudoalteromonas sp. J010]|uniref:non-ribosomal peptide synthetase n=1 Tax=Pseudoalteromonas sp. J010 TaxID=998465 RepID=UPI000F64C74F|nr:non-ribosomal peptide synthetase [Pseudoalteromonas sp. J010]RRS10213.1 amino acid adenylation domain-containing protein [Pseudoalteromonas sp. J010]